MTRILAFLLIVLVLPFTAHAASDDDSANGKTNLPLPRFATLRTDEVNMRTGPGTRYPIQWVMTHRGLPVEIIAEYDFWRRVRDADGDEGWVHKTELTGKRAAIVKGARDLFNDADTSSGTAAHLEAGAMGQLLSCAKDWCRLKFEDVKGYLPKNAFWGAYPEETFD